MQRFKSIFSVLATAVLIGFTGVGCKSTKRASANYYSLSERKVSVESLVVEVRDFHGRPDVFADIRGRLSSNGAVLRDVEQFREGEVLILNVTESTPLNSFGTRDDPPFQTRVPLEVWGYISGQTYTVRANGAETEFTMP